MALSKNKHSSSSPSRGAASAGSRTKQSGKKLKGVGNPTGGTRDGKSTAPALSGRNSHSREWQINRVWQGLVLGPAPHLRVVPPAPAPAPALAAPALAQVRHNPNPGSPALSQAPPAGPGELFTPTQPPEAPIPGLYPPELPLAAPGLSPTAQQGRHPGAFSLPPFALTHPDVSHSAPHTYSIITSALAPLWEAYLTPNPSQSSPKR